MLRKGSDGDLFVISRNSWSDLQWSAEVHRSRAGRSARAQSTALLPGCTAVPTIGRLPKRACGISCRPRCRCSRRRAWSGVLHGGGQGGSNSSLVCPIVGGDGAAGGETGEHLAVGVATRLDGGGFGSRPGWVVPRSAPRAVAGVGNCAIDIGGICWCGSQGARVTVVAAAVATPATATANRRRRVIIVVIGESFPNAGGAAVSTSN